MRRARTATGPVVSPPRLASVGAAAARYGVDRRTFYRWIDKGIVPIVRVGPAQTIRVDVAEADRVLMPADGTPAV